MELTSDPNNLTMWRQSDVPDISRTVAILREKYRPFELTGRLVVCPCCGEMIDEAGLAFMLEEKGAW